MLTLLTTSMSFSSAIAETDERPDKKRVHVKTILTGVGGAVDSEDHGHRSWFKIGMIPSSDTATDAASNEAQIKRGQFVIRDNDTREKYHVVPDTWSIDVRPDKSGFSAFGNVEDKNGDVFKVELSGEHLRDLANGKMYLVTGILSGGEISYELYYISAMFDRLPRIDSAPTDIEEL